MKKLLLALGAAAMAVSASATVFNQGEAFAYTIDPSFSFDLAGDTDGYGQYPADALKGQASMEYGFGMASAWFNGRKFATPAEANEWCPVVADPFNTNGYAIRMQTTAWDGFGNFNFALPEVGEPCRVRVIYRVDQTAAENAWYADKAQKTFKVKLMDDADQDTYDYAQVEEYNEDFWNNPGWRVADFISDLATDQYYLSLLWDAGGLSCQRNVPFYVEEVSVVPLSKLSGYTAPADGAGITITNTMPDLVTFGGAVSGNYEIFAQGEAFGYDIDPTFSFDLAGDTDGYGQYPADALKGQASMEYGFGMASAWFNGRKFATPAEANEWCPVVADPFNTNGYAIRMQTTAWDGFGNFNFALPEVGEPCRVRVIYRVDQTAAENAWYADKAQKTFKVKLMDDADQDTYDYAQVEEYNEDFWNNPGWRVAEFISDLATDQYYLSLLWDAGGLSCQRNVPFYVEEVSVVPVSKLNDYVAPADGAALNVVTEMPALVKIDRTGGIGDIVADDVISNEAPVYYNLQGVQVNNPSKGIYIVRTGKKVTKQVIR
ncbi:MAG: hypothetical protein K2K37_07150 [Muribaculaceae bacterium]|nr:hypothetical protein [Muribaculaceae bacterium]